MLQQLGSKLVCVWYIGHTSIIVGCHCRGAVQADAQALRAAVLLDELDFPGFGVHDPRTGHIVVEMRTPHGASLLKYSCSPRVLCLPTIQLNARRLAQLITQSCCHHLQ